MLRLSAGLLLIPAALGALVVPAFAQQADRVLYVDTLSDNQDLDSIDQGSTSGSLECWEQDSGGGSSQLLCHDGVTADCTLRSAILCANAYAGNRFEIRFRDLPGAMKIEPTGALPAITADHLVIDGFQCANCAETPDPGTLYTAAEELLLSDPAAALADFQIGPTLDGSSLPVAAAHLLKVQANDVVIRGLHLRGASAPATPNAAAVFFGPRDNDAFSVSGGSLSGCFIGGLDRSGLALVGRRNDVGVLLRGHGGVQISHNLLSGNKVAGVMVHPGGGGHSQITRNLIGPLADGAAHGNGMAPLAGEVGAGVVIEASSDQLPVEGVTIGNPDNQQGGGNLILDNYGPGVLLSGNVRNVVIVGNSIGSSVLNRGNEGPGIRIEGKPATQVSPQGFQVQANHIVSNLGAGIVVDGAQDGSIEGNHIGKGHDPTAPTQPFNAAGGVVLLGGARGATSGVSVGQRNVEEERNHIYTAESHPPVRIQTGADDDSDFGGDSAFENLVGLNAYSTAHAQVIDHVHWETQGQGAGRLAGQGSDRDFLGGYTDANLCKAVNWEGRGVYPANEMTRPPVLHAAALQDPKGEQGGPFLWAYGTACDPASLGLFVRPWNGATVNPVETAGDPMHETAFHQEGGLHSFSLAGVGPISNAQKGSFISAQIAALTGNSSELSEQVVLQVCQMDGQDADDDGFSANRCESFSNPASIDCDDNNDSVHPSATEDCNDGLDNDCDELVDLDDPDCPEAGDDDDDAADDDESPGDDDDESPGDDDDEPPGGFRPPGCVISCGVAAGVPDHSALVGLALIALAARRTRPAPSSLEQRK